MKKHPEFGIMMHKKITGDFKAFHALACCNIYGIWGNSLET